MRIITRRWIGEQGSDLYPLEEIVETTRGHDLRITNEGIWLSNKLVVEFELDEDYGFPIYDDIPISPLVTLNLMDPKTRMRFSEVEVRK